MKAAAYALGAVIAFGILVWQSIPVQSQPQKPVATDTATPPAPAPTPSRPVTPKQEPVLKQSKEKERQPAATPTQNRDCPTQSSSGDNSPNFATCGDQSPIIINPPTNPYLPTVTYDFNGGKHIVQGNVFKAEFGEQVTAFQTMLTRHDAKDWRGLLDICSEQSQKAPGWFTSYFYAGIAYANLGDREQAIKLLRYVNSNVGHLEHYNDSGRLLRQLGGQ